MFADMLPSFSYFLSGLANKTRNLSNPEKYKVRSGTEEVKRLLLIFLDIQKAATPSQAGQFCGVQMDPTTPDPATWPETLVLTVDGCAIHFALVFLIRLPRNAVLFFLQISHGFNVCRIP